MAKTRRWLVTATVLAVAWLAWSGHYTPLLLTLGLLSCALAIWLAVRTGFFDDDIYSLYLGPGLPRYWAWLLAEIARANIEVALDIVAPRTVVSPTIRTVDASDFSPVAQTMIINSVTLTPGTVSMNVDGGRIEVHCLTRKIADELDRGEIVKRVMRLSGEER